MSKKWRKVIQAVVGSDGWKKLVKPTVQLHGTAFPKLQKDLEKIGIRFDFAGTVEKPDGSIWHRFQAQVNAGSKIPTSWKEWREGHARGTHANVATIEVPDQGSKDDVEAALKKVEDSID